jgi:hypothetical protein
MGQRTVAPSKSRRALGRALIGSPVARLGADPASVCAGSFALLLVLLGGIKLLAPTPPAAAANPKAAQVMPQERPLTPAERELSRLCRNHAETSGSAWDILARGPSEAWLSSEDVRGLVERLHLTFEWRCHPSPHSSEARVVCKGHPDGALEFDLLAASSRLSAPLLSGRAETLRELRQDLLSGRAQLRVSPDCRAQLRW